MKRRAQFLLCMAAGCAAGWCGSFVFLPAQEPSRRSVVIPLKLESGRRSAQEKPDDAIIAVHRAGGPGAQIQAALALANSARPEDFRRLLEQARFLPANPYQALFRRALLRRWMTADPAAAAAWCAGSLDNQVDEAMRLWTLQDPSAARAFLNTLPAHHRRKAVAGIAEGLAERDPVAAMKFIAAADEDDAWELRRAFRIMAQAGSRQLLESAESLSGELRGAARGVAVEEWTRQNTAAAVAWAQSQPDSHDLVMRALNSSRDKTAAFQALMTLPPALQKQVASSCAYELFRADPFSMLDQIGQRKDLPPEVLVNLSEAASYYAAAQDPAAALAKLQSAFPDNAGNWARNLARLWAEKDTTAASAWVATLASPLREEMQGVVTSTVSRSEQAAAATMGQTAIANLRHSQYVSPGTVLRLPSADRSALLEEMSTLQPGDQRLWNSERGFVEHYPAEYARWLSARPDLETRRNAISNLTQSWSAAEPAAAAAWIVTLPDGNSRDQAMDSVLRNWNQTDPAAAAAWAGSLPAGPERERMNELLKAPPF